MSKSIAEQLHALGLVSEFKAGLADDLARRKVLRECYKRASRAALRVDSDHREVVVEYRRHRALAK